MTNSKKTVTVVPAVVQEPNHMALLRCQMVTHHATCDSQMHVYLNEIFTDQHRENAKQITKEAEALGYVCHVWSGDFNLSAMFNAGLDETDSDYIVYALQDCYYIGDWLTPLQELLDTGEHHSAQGVSLPCQKYRTYWDIEEEVHVTSNAVGSHWVMRRDNGWRWDEKVIDTFYIDQRYREWLEDHEMNVALCKRSRVEHSEGNLHMTKTHCSRHLDDIEPNERYIRDMTRSLRKKQKQNGLSTS